VRWEAEMGHKASTIQLPELWTNIYRGAAKQSLGQALHKGRRRGREKAAAKPRLLGLVDQQQEKTLITPHFNTYSKYQVIFSKF